jgi:peptidyl-prolyl cis-trans isomerase D
MLGSIRTATKSWLGYTVLIVLVALLVVAFAIYGIGDVLQGRADRTLARVGDVEISVETFRDAYQRELVRQQRALGQPLTTAQARLFGLDRQVLDRLVDEAALDEKMRSLGIRLSREKVLDLIRNEPGFQTGGAFDAARFGQQLQALQMNEQRFVAEFGASTLRSHLAEAVGGGAATPRALVDLLDRQQRETRDVAFVRITDRLVGDVQMLDEAGLRTFVEERAAEFQRPEFRGATVLALTPETVLGPITVTDEEIRAAFDAAVAAGEIGTPERRTLQQLSFADEAAARAARARLAEGAVTFEALAAELGQAAGFEIGSRNRIEIALPALADPVFALPVEGVTEPIRIGAQWLLVRVTAITPAALPPIEAERARLEGEIRAARLADPALRQRIEEIHDAIETERGEGRSLAEIAAARGYVVAAVPAIDAAGRDAAGRPIALPEAETLATAVFGSGIGVDNEAVRLRQGGYMWFEIAGIEPARPLTFEEARAEASARWLEEETARRLTARIAAMRQALEEGARFETIAEQNGLTVETLAGAKVDGGALGASIGRQIFVTPKDAYGEGRTVSGERILFQVRAVATPPFDPASDVAVRVGEALAPEMARDLIALYVADLRRRFGASVDETALSAALASN